MDRFALIFGGVFGLVGLAMLVFAGALLFSELAFRHEAVRVEGKVIDLVSLRGGKGGSTWKPRVEYLDRNGVAHRATGGVASNPPSFEIGDKVEVFYRSEDPDNAHVGGFMQSWFGPLLLGVMGTVFSGVGGGFLFFLWRKRRIRAWLADNGMRVQARYVGVDYDRSVRINGRCPWRINAQWQHPVTKLVYEFKSDALWFDPTPYVNRETLDVRVNADDPRQYMIDTSFLPKSA